MRARFFQGCGKNRGGKESHSIAKHSRAKVAAISLLSVLPMWAPLAQAENPFYGFADVGFTQYKASIIDEAAAGFSLGVGYEMSDELSIEAAYNDYGNSATRSSAGVEGDFEFSSGSLVANIGNYELRSDVQVFAIVGMEYLDADQDLIPNGTNQVANVSSSGMEAQFGIGTVLQGDGGFAKARIRLTSNADGEVLRLVVGVKLF